MSGLKRNLPSKVTNINDERRCRNQLRKLMSKAAESYGYLLDVLPSLKSEKRKVELRDFSKVEWLDNLIDKRILAVDDLADGDMADVLEGQIAYAKKRWQTTKAKCHEAVAVIKALYTFAPNGDFYFDHDHDRLRCRNIDEIVEAKVGVEVSDDAVELYRLYCNTYDDLQRLNRYCQEHGYKPFQGSAIGRWKTPTDFIQVWNIGGFSLNPTDEQLNRRVQVEDDRPRITDRDGRAVM